MLERRRLIYVIFYCVSRNIGYERDTSKAWIYYFLWNHIVANSCTYKVTVLVTVLMKYRIKKEKKNVIRYCRKESPRLLIGCFCPEDVVSVGSLCEVGCERLVSLVLEAGLRIRIHFIRIRVQHFRLNTDPDPGLEWQKIEKKLQLKKKLNFLWSKTTIYLSVGLHKEHPSYRRSLQLSKEAIQHFKTWTLKKNLYFCGSFLPSWIRIRIPKPGPDPLTRLNPDPQPWLEVPAPANGGRYLVLESAGGLRYAQPDQIQPDQRNTVFENNYEYGNYQYLFSVLGIRDILVRIRIRGSVPLTNGSGSDFFLQWL